MVFSLVTFDSFRLKKKSFYGLCMRWSEKSRLVWRDFPAAKKKTRCLAFVLKERRKCGIGENEAKLCNLANHNWRRQKNEPMKAKHVSDANCTKMRE